MNPRLFMAQFYLPVRLKRKKLLELIDLTSEAFTMKETGARKEGSVDELLRGYARFTKKTAEKALADTKEIETIKKKLFTAACAMGNRLRQELRVASFRDFRVAIRIIYKTLKIDCACGKNKTVVMKKCFFSDFYSGEVCSLISSLDAGLVAGLSGGLTLSFYERITENKPVCRARILP